MFDRAEEKYTELIRCTPSEASFLLLLRTDPATVSPAAALGVGVGAARHRRTLEAVEVKSLARAACAPRDPAEPDAVAHEYAAGTGMYPPSAVHRVEVARRADARLPLTVKALHDATITYRQLEAIELATRDLSADQAAEVEAASLAGTTRGLSRRLTAAIARIAPEQAKKKTEQIRRSRTAMPWSDPAEGVAGIALQGPLDQVAQIKAAIDTDARLRLAGDPRPLETRRFDVLYDWARDRLGLPPAQHPDRPTPPPAAPTNPGSAASRCGSCGRSGPNTIPINVTVSLETLLGLSELPGDLDGAPIPASVARELAADGRWRRWIVEASTGRLLD
ncbi:MAG TPA: DUF222 domain-containing protein, partial [Frankiaceae bacterium]|nr:DUF222 domain-containing protein [Frankiaceae bacterium]